jgi:quercetin dioxygenase-like cupin family protein
MHYVSKFDPADMQTPLLYANRSHDFKRAALIDHKTGSVHMGTGISELAPGGVIEPHLHSFEESFYVLDGTMIG